MDSNGPIIADHDNIVVSDFEQERDVFVGSTEFGASCSESVGEESGGFHD